MKRILRKFFVALGKRHAAKRPLLLRALEQAGEIEGRELQFATTVHALKHLTDEQLGYVFGFALGMLPDEDIECIIADLHVATALWIPHRD